MKSYSPFDWINKDHEKLLITKNFLKIQNIKNNNNELEMYQKARAFIEAYKFNVDVTNASASRKQGIRDFKKMVEMNRNKTLLTATVVADMRTAQTHEDAGDVTAAAASSSKTWAVDQEGRNCWDIGAADVDLSNGKISDEHEWTKKRPEGKFLFSFLFFSIVFTTISYFSYFSFLFFFLFSTLYLVDDCLDEDDFQEMTEFFMAQAAKKAVFLHWNGHAFEAKTLSQHCNVSENSLLDMCRAFKSCFPKVKPSNTDTNYQMSFSLTVLNWMFFGEDAVYEHRGLSDAVCMAKIVSAFVRVLSTDKYYNCFPSDAELK